jgi:hypothetical protein
MPPDHRSRPARRRRTAEAPLSARARPRRAPRPRPARRDDQLPGHCLSRRRFGAWLYMQPELRIEFERLRNRHPPATSRQPNAERAREPSLRQRNTIRLAEPKRLREENAAPARRARAASRRPPRSARPVSGGRRARGQHGQVVRDEAGQRPRPRRAPAPRWLWLRSPRRGHRGDSRLEELYRDAKILGIFEGQRGPAVGHRPPPDRAGHHRLTAPATRPLTATPALTRRRKGRRPAPSAVTSSKRAQNPGKRGRPAAVVERR